MKDIYEFIERIYPHKKNISTIKKVSNVALNIYYEELDEKFISELESIKVPVGLEYNIRLICHFYLVLDLDLDEYYLFRVEMENFLEHYYPEASTKLYLSAMNYIYDNTIVEIESELECILYIIITIIEYSISLFIK